MSLQGKRAENRGNICLYINFTHVDKIKDFRVLEDLEIRPYALWNWEQPFQREVS